MILRVCLSCMICLVTSFRVPIRTLLEKELESSSPRKAVVARQGRLAEAQAAIKEVSEKAAGHSASPGSANEDRDDM